MPAAAPAAGSVALSWESPGANAGDGGPLDLIILFWLPLTPEAGLSAVAVAAAMAKGDTAAGTGLAGLVPLPGAFSGDFEGLEVDEACLRPEKRKRTVCWVPETQNKWQ